MFAYLKKDRWSAYAVGVMLALLSLGSFYFVEAMLGVSSTFVRLAAMILNLIAPNYVASNDYYVSLLEGNYWINWQFALVAGLAIGAYIASRLHAPIKVSYVPSIWKKNFGPSKGIRFFGTFVGGMFLSFGARIAGGCTSGHAITGGMQLAVTSYIFMAAVFAIGIPTAFILYTQKGAQ